MENEKPLLIKTCEFWEQVGSDNEKGHKHICKNPKNLTWRCGYELDDWRHCPIHGKPEIRKRIS